MNAQTGTPAGTPGESEAGTASISSAPFLTTWFGILDDFSFSILFSTGGDAGTDFHGGRAEMEGYLAQREVGVRTHHPLTASAVGRDERYL